MGVIFSGAFAADGLGLLQGWHYGSRSDKFSRLSCELDFQSLRLDVLGTIREEIRDQVFVIMSSLDNLMVVATLMLSLGFGFVVEGTFPPKTAEALQNWELWFFSVDPLVVYAFLASMSLICPLWCVIFTIRMRYQVDSIVREHMKELKRQLCNILKKQQIQSPHENEPGQVQRQISSPLEHRIDIGAACPKRFQRVLGACPTRRQNIEDAANLVASYVGGTATISSDFTTIDQDQIVKWAEKDLLQRMSTYCFYMKAAHLLLWIGMLCAIFTASILLGLYMMEQFPNTPLVWQTYSSVVAFNGGLAIVFTVWMWTFSSANPVRAVSPCQHGGSVEPSCRRDSTMPSFTLPLLQNASTGVLGCSPTSQGSSQDGSCRTSDVPARSPYDPQEVALRVRDADSERLVFREVLVPVKSGRLAVDLAGLERLVCAKFQHRISKVSSLLSLVRMRDHVEIVDATDVGRLVEGDELWAVFGPQ
mmetsp:Transcript_57458/g.159030  ORF Transcript_57458/g.159030 Transcript_57458/m.159030 type:complete len:477 (+) Transcript_57458:55-1485(+)